MVKPTQTRSIDPAIINLQLNYTLHKEIDEDVSLKELTEELLWLPQNPKEPPPFFETSIPIGKYLELFKIANKKITLQSSYKQKRIVEDFKLQLMESFYIHLHNSKNLDTKESKNPPRFMLARKIAVGILTLFGLILDGAGSFLFCNASFSLIPGISGAALFGSSLACTLLNGALFYSFEANMLRKAFGVSVTDLNSAMSYKIINKQINLVKKINAELKNINFLKNPDIKSTLDNHIAIAKEFNQHIHAKKNHFKKTPESSWWKILKVGLTVFGGLMAVASGYFYTTSLLAVVAPALATTPIGIVINAVGAFIALTFYASMRASGMMSLGGDSIKTYEKVSKKIEKFDAVEENKSLDKAKDYVIPKDYANGSTTKTLETFGQSNHKNEKQDANTSCLSPPPEPNVLSDTVYIDPALAITALGLHPNEHPQGPLLSIRT